MNPCKEVLDIFKGGIREFIELGVKQQHEHLLARLPDIASSGFTRLESCFECNRNNLQPRHSENECPSSNYCFCKNRRKAKRPCPNSICDFIYEGIMEDHIEYSPNLKNTDISQWTQNYWDIAKCYMKNSCMSAESTDLLDLLHLIANNRFLQQKLLSKGRELSAEIEETEFSELRILLNKVIKICRRIKRSTGICLKDDLTKLCQFLSKVDDQNSTKSESHKLLTYIDCTEPGKRISYEELNQCVYEYFKSAENSLHCRQTDAMVDGTHSLKLLFEQKLLVADTVKSFKKGLFTESSIIDAIFGSRSNRTICVAPSSDDVDQRSAQWSEKEWFIYNVLNIHFNAQENKNDVPAPLNKDCGYSDIIVVTKSVSNRANMALKPFCEGILNDVLPTLENCLVLLDFGDAVVEGVFKQGKSELKRHTTIKLHKTEAFHNMKSKGRLDTAYVKTMPVNELTLRNVGKDLKLEKEATDIIHQILYKSMRKIGDKHISSLTFERICFDDISTKVKLSCISHLTKLRLRECAFTPVNFKCVLSIEILSRDTNLSFHLEQAKVILYPAIQTCHGLQQVKTSEIKIGNKLFCMKLSSKELDDSAKEYFGTALRSCSRDEVYDLLCIEMAKILMLAGSDINDFQTANDEEEKTMVLNSIKFGLLKGNQKFVTVYPAECCLKSRKSKNIVFVGYMKENIDSDQECVWGKYRGFETFQRSYNEVSPESFLAESSVVDLKDAYRIITDEQMKTDIEETVAFHSKELMKEHSNLEVIGVSMGKARNSSLDLSEGPYIVLYVRLKSFIPSGEKRFPSKLSHPFKQSVEFKTDVREGYYIHLADNNLSQFYPEVKVPQLVMGCSIGFPGNDTAATVGPFVEIESSIDEIKTKEIGFITVCHLFGWPEDAQTIVGRHVVQPSDGDEPFVNLSTRELELGFSNDKVCGEVVACSYNTEVDVALVKITRRHPRNGSFITCQRRDLKDAGFSGELEYKDGSISNLTDAFRQNVVKVGKTTKLSLGLCCLKAGAVKIFKDTLSVPHPLTRERRSIDMTNLFQIVGIGNKTFSDSGDSGAGVFIVGSENKLSCIGMVIGKTSDGNCIATPIHTILDKLSGSSFTGLDNLKVTMKTFDN